MDATTRPIPTLCVISVLVILSRDSPTCCCHDVTAFLAAPTPRLSSTINIASAHAFIYSRSLVSTRVKGQVFPHYREHLGSPVMAGSRDFFAKEQHSPWGDSGGGGGSFSNCE